MCFCRNCFAEKAFHSVNAATYSTIKLREHRMWVVQIIFIFRFRILRDSVNPFLLLQKQVSHCKWIRSCCQEVSAEQCPKCYVLAGLRFCRSCRCCLHVGFWKLNFWKFLINQLIFQIDILLPLKIQFSWLWFQNCSTGLATTSKMFIL